MIEIRQETDPAIVDKIKGHFIEDGAYNSQVIASELIESMAYDPTAVCVLVGYADEVVIGLIVAWVPVNREYVWLDQAWVDQKYKDDITLKGFSKLEAWTKDRSLKEIRCETERNSAAIQRKWGFIEHGVIMTREIK